MAVRAARHGWSRLREFVSPMRRVQAEADFLRACVLLQMREMVMSGMPDHQVASSVPELNDKYLSTSLGEKMASANDAVTAQVLDLFQALYDLDSGDVATPAVAPKLPPGATNAAIETSVGPSTHTNPLVTMEAQVQALHGDDLIKAGHILREYLSLRCGFALAVGPSQAQTPEHTAGVYIKGYVPPGTVVGLYPGRVYSSEMLMKAQDFGHLANPKIPRSFVVRFDGAMIEVNESTDDSGGMTPKDVLSLANHVRHPPRDITPNTMRLQYDFMGDLEESSLPLTPIPPHLRPYIPNEWGSDVTMSQGFVGQMVDQGIYMKGAVLVTTREVFDEELFVDHQLNPFGKVPEWYHAIDVEADERLWESVVTKAKTRQRSAAAVDR